MEEGGKRREGIGEGVERGARGMRSAGKMEKRRSLEEQVCKRKKKADW